MAKTVSVNCSDFTRIADDIYYESNCTAVEYSDSGYRRITNTDVLYWNGAAIDISIIGALPMPGKYIPGTTPASPKLTAGRYHGNVTVVHDKISQFCIDSEVSATGIVSKYETVHGATGDIHGGRWIICTDGVVVRLYDTCMEKYRLPPALRSEQFYDLGAPITYCVSGGSVYVLVLTGMMLSKHTGARATRVATEYGYALTVRDGQALYEYQYSHDRASMCSRSTDRMVLPNVDDEIDLKSIAVDNISIDFQIVNDYKYNIVGALNGRKFESRGYEDRSGSHVTVNLLLAVRKGQIKPQIYIGVDDTTVLFLQDGSCVRSIPIKFV